MLGNKLLRRQYYKINLHGTLLKLRDKSISYNLNWSNAPTRNVILIKNKEFSRLNLSIGLFPDVLLEMRLISNLIKNNKEFRDSSVICFNF